MSRERSDRAGSPQSAGPWSKVRPALVELASRLDDNRALAAEVAALEADGDDRAEMLAVAELMESLSAPE